MQSLQHFSLLFVFFKAPEALQHFSTVSKACNEALVEFFAQQRVIYLHHFPEYTPYSVFSMYKNAQIVYGKARPSFLPLVRFEQIVIPYDALQANAKSETHALQVVQALGNCVFYNFC